jgi:uncharacterized linocin/CFP29 family protein
MKHIDSLWQDGVLTEADYKLLKQVVIETPVWGLAARKVLPVKQVDKAARMYQYQTLSDYGSADTIAPGADFPGMQLDGTLSNVNIAKIGIAFNIPREDVLASSRAGMPLDTKNAAIAADKVTKKEDNIVWNGDTKYGITGVVNESGLATYTSSGWASGDVYDDIRKAAAQVQDEYSGRRMSLVGNRDDIVDLYRKNTNTDSTYATQIKELGIEPVMSTYMTSGTALLIPEGRDICELVVAEELDLEMDYEKAKNQTYAGDVFVRSAPVVYNAGAIVKLSSV